MEMEIRPATRRQAKGRMLLFGPSGSGKTYSALRVARGMGGKVVVIDTEHGSSEKYAGDFDFDVLPLTPPYSPQRFMQAFKVVADAGYEVCIADSITHEWDGTGGVKEIVDEAKSRFGGNSQAAWSVGTPLHNKFLETILRAPFHVIATARSRTEWVPGEDSRGRQVFNKAGVAPMQRDTIEYEFDVTLLLDPDNAARVMKTRANPHFPPLQVFEKLTEDTGALFLDWLTQGSTPAPVPAGDETTETTETAAAPAPDIQISESMVDAATTRIEALQQDFGDFEPGVTWASRMDERIREWWAAESISDLTPDQLATLIERLDASRTKKQRETTGAAA